jgi:hypothetical protein
MTNGMTVVPFCGWVKTVEPLHRAVVRERSGVASWSARRTDAYRVINLCSLVSTSRAYVLVRTVPYQAGKFTFLVMGVENQ